MCNDILLTAIRILQYYIAMLIIAIGLLLVAIAVNLNFFTFWSAYIWVGLALTMVTALAALFSRSRLLNPQNLKGCLEENPKCDPVYFNDYSNRYNLFKNTRIITALIVLSITLLIANTPIWGAILSGVSISLLTFLIVLLTQMINHLRDWRNNCF